MTGLNINAALGIADDEHVIWPATRAAIERTGFQIKPAPGLPTSKLGQGSFATVFYAEHRQNKRPAAIKVFHSEAPDLLESFKNESKTVEGPEFAREFAAETTLTQPKPDADRLQKEFRVWLEAGDHLPLVDAKKLTHLELLDLDNAVFTWRTELRLRVNCELKPGIEVTLADRQRTRDEFQVLIADPQAGFLKQTLPNFPSFSAHTTDGRSFMATTVITLAEVVLGKSAAPSVAPPPPIIPPIIIWPTLPRGAGAGGQSVEIEGRNPYYRIDN